MTKRYQLLLEVEDLPLRPGCMGPRRYRHPNAYAVVKVSGGPQNGKVIGQTSVVPSTRNPVWTDILFIDTDSSVYMPLLISIYDDESYRDCEQNIIADMVITGCNSTCSMQPNTDRLIGEVTFEAFAIYESVGRIKSEKIGNGATIRACMEESVQGDLYGHVNLQIRGLDIKNIERGILDLGRSDPYFEISKKMADYSAGVVKWNVVYRSKHIHNHLNPFWREFTIGLEELCHCDPGWPLRITVFDWEASSKHRVIGSFETTLNGLRETIAVRGNADRELAFEIKGEDEQQLHSTGLICILKAEIVPSSLKEQREMSV